MKKTKPDTSYERIDKIISLFNTSVSHFNSSCLGSGDNSDSQEALNIAGERLYCCFEAAIKNVLVNYWRSQQEKGLISYRDFNNPHRRDKPLAKKQEIERDDRPKLISKLKNHLDKGEVVPLHSLVIDFDVIQRNAWKVTNANKHRAENVDKTSYLESLQEIRRFIFSFIQPDAKLTMEDEEGGSVSQQALGLLEKWNYMEHNPLWNYVLIVDSVSMLTEAQQKAIASVNWAVVMDTDSATCETGLVNAFEKLRGIQPERFLLDHPERTDFHEYAESPYWYFLNGIDSVPNSLNNGTSKNWRQKNRYLRDAIERYHARFPRNVRILVFSKCSEIVSEVLREIDTYYEQMQLVFTSSTHQHFCDEYSDSDLLLMEIDDLARTILANGSRFNMNGRASDIYMPSHQGMVAVVASQYSHLELIHQNLADPDKATLEEQDALQFYRGSLKLSWYGADRHFDIERTASFNQLSRRIGALDNKYATLIVEHYPGSGGTTFMRSFAFRKCTEYPTVILRQYSKDETARQIKNLYSELRTQILILSDEFEISKQQIDALHKELKSESFPFVIVYSKRGKPKSKSLMVNNLDDIQFDKMVDKLKPYITDEAHKKLLRLRSDKNRVYRTPFFISLTAFDEGFTGIKPFIKRFLTDKSLTEEQKKMLVYISLADRYANRHISVDAFPGVMRLQESQSDEVYSPIEELVVIDQAESAATSNYRIRHVRFADEIINQRLFTDSAGDAISDSEKASNLVECLIQLIHDSKSNVVVDYDVTLDLLRNMFIERDRSELNMDRFSPLVTKIQQLSSCDGNGNAQVTRIGRLFKELVSTYPEDPHFKAHLSRYYTYIEGDYDKGVDTAWQAIEAQRDNSQNDDPVLHHIYGISLSKRILEQIMPQILKGDVATDRGIEDLLSDADDALDAFEWSIDSLSPNAGYYASINLCIEILDFAKKLYGCHSAYELYEKTADEENPWYLEFLDTATDLLEEWKAEDNSEHTIEFAEDDNSHSKNGGSIADEKFKLKGRLNAFYGDLASLERTIDMWRKSLDIADSSNIALRRRLLAQAKQRRLRLIGYENALPHEIDEIMQLAESNIQMEPSNGANIRIWFDAVRYCTSMNPEKLLDYALDKLDVWRVSTEKIEAYFYYFVCTCIKARDGSSKHQAAIPVLQKELQQKSAGRPDRKDIHEWLGKGKGLQRLIKFKGLPVPEDDHRNLDVLGGTVSVYRNEVNATVLSHGMQVFVNPSRAKPKLGKSIEGKKVTLSIGFCYDGARAYDQTVAESTDLLLQTGIPSESLLEVKVGLRVKCRVVSHSPYFVNVKLVDYPEQEGSVHLSKLGDGYSTENLPNKGEHFYATVVGEKKARYWPLSMLASDAEQDSILSKWKKEDGRFIKSN